MKDILTAWKWNGSVSEPIPYGEGHINQTYAITVTSVQGAKRYILQKINTNTFKDPAGLMENICGVTDFLREKAKQRGADPARATLHVVPTKEEKPYYQAADGSCWRIYEFVENTVCLQQVQSAEDFYQSAVAFGNFQHQLAEYPAHTLHETIPHFHDTADRFRQLREVPHAAAEPIQPVADDRRKRFARVFRQHLAECRAVGGSGGISLVRVAADFRVRIVQLRVCAAHRRLIFHRFAAPGEARFAAVQRDPHRARAPQRAAHSAIARICCAVAGVTVIWIFCGWLMVGCAPFRRILTAFFHRMRMGRRGCVSGE